MIQQQLQQRKAYLSDLTDAAWNFITSFIPGTQSNKKTGGRPEKYPKREIVNAILYVVSSGCRYADIPHDLPQKSITWKYFNRWSANGVWKKVNTALRRWVRLCVGRNEDPTHAIIDSQAIKATDIALETGYDAGKKIKGRKRHLLTDTEGLLLDVVVHSAGVQDRDGAKTLLRHAKSTLSTIENIAADGGYAGKLVTWVREKFGITLDIIKRNELHTFVVLHTRWIIERTNAWVSKARRLARDYERKTLNQESMIYVRMIQLMLKWV
jgi:putative transposase